MNKTLWAFIAGAAAGAALGILYAPAKGSETRKKLSDSANKIADSIQDSGVIDMISNVKETVYNKVNEFTSSGDNQYGQSTGQRHV